MKRIDTIAADFASGIDDKKMALDVAAIQKEMIEAIAKRATKYNKTDEFYMATSALVLVICCLIDTFNLKEIIDQYLKDLTKQVKMTHPHIEEVSTIMVYKDGKKIQEHDIKKDKEIH